MKTKISLLLFCLFGLAGCSNNVAKIYKNGLPATRPIVLAPVFSNTNSDGRLLLSNFLPEIQKDVEVLANWENKIPCPVELTNLLSNTNLISPEEEQMFKGLVNKYKDLSFDTVPVGTVHRKSGARNVTARFLNSDVKRVRRDLTVSYHRYKDTNSLGTIELVQPGVSLVARIRNSSKDGFDLEIGRAENGLDFSSLEFLNGVPNGLSITVNRADEQDQARIVSLVRFKDGLAVGKFIRWDLQGNLSTFAEFKKPFEFIDNQIHRVDQGWLFEATWKFRFNSKMDGWY